MKRLTIVLSALLAGYATSRASTIVSTFSTTPPGYVSDSYQVSLYNGVFGSSGTDWAMGFTVPSGSDFLFTGFAVPFTFSGTAATVDFTLASDASGAPGTPLETIGINLSDGTSVYTGNSSLNPILIGGASYWLEAAISSSDPGNDAAWNAAAGIFSGLALGPTADKNFPIFGTWEVFGDTQAAFAIDGTAVPEPRYGWVVILGLLLATIGMPKLFRASATRPR
jgi:hypothetical protein